MSLRAKLIAGETVGPGMGVPKSSITSIVSQVRKEGYDVETLGAYRYRLRESNGSQPNDTPPIPGDRIEMLVTELHLEDDELVVSATVGDHEIRFIWG